MADPAQDRDFFENMHLAAVLSEAVSHKLNNSLSGIVGYVQFALEKMDRQALDRKGIEEIRRYLSIARDESSYSRALMQSLRWFSKDHFERAGIRNHGQCVLGRTLQAFWEGFRGLPGFSRMEVEFSGNGLLDTAVAVPVESLFLLFYSVLQGILRLSADEGPVRVSLGFSTKGQMFLEAAFGFAAAESLGERALADHFALSLALVKSAFSQVRFEARGADVLIQVDVPLVREKV